MFLLEIERSRTNSMQTKLPKVGLQVDPRPFGGFDVNRMNGMTFSITYHEDGRTVTITRTDRDRGWEKEYRSDIDFNAIIFRVYDPETEVVPSFDSTIYTYTGVKGDIAPWDTTVGIVDPSVKFLPMWVFHECTKMRICLMGDGVEEIDGDAFHSCDSLHSVRLSRSLKKIGDGAFGYCKSLDALFIPSSIEEIEDGICRECNNIRILSLPSNITTQQIGGKILQWCDTFFDVTQIQGYVYDSADIDNEEYENATNNEEVNQAFLEFYHKLPPLNKVCHDTNVSARSIHECVRTYGAAAAFATDHNKMTPLHILTMNPYATTGSILTCLHFNMSATFAMDDEEMTPLDYLRKSDNVECLVSIIQALCIHREMYSEQSICLMDEGKNSKRSRVG